MQVAIAKCRNLLNEKPQMNNLDIRLNTKNQEWEIYDFQTEEILNSYKTQKEAEEILCLTKRISQACNPQT